MKKYDELSGPEFEVLEYEFKEGLNAYVKSTSGRIKSLADVIAFDNQHEESVMPFFKQEILDSSVIKESLDSKKYLDLYNKLQSIRKFLSDLMAKENLDAICGPATGPSWCIDLINGDHFTGYGAYGPAATAGYPSITVPMGLVHELPVGLSFIGKEFDEPGLIAIAYSYEQASMNRKAPKFLKNNLSE